MKPKAPDPRRPWGPDGLTVGQDRARRFAAATQGSGKPASKHAHGTGKPPGEPKKAAKK